VTFRKYLDAEVSIPNIVLGYNNTGYHFPCGLCPGWVDAPVPLAIVVRATDALVCDECARKYVPELWDALLSFYQYTNKRDMAELP
jgi:hypothetical protein